MHKNDKIINCKRSDWKQGRESLQDIASGIFPILLPATTTCWCMYVRLHSIQCQVPDGKGGGLEQSSLQYLEPLPNCFSSKNAFGIFLRLFESRAPHLIWPILKLQFYFAGFFDLIKIQSCYVLFSENYSAEDGETSGPLHNSFSTLLRLEVGRLQNTCSNIIFWQNGMEMVGLEDILYGNTV